MTIFLETKRLIIKVPTPADFENWCAVHAESDVVQLSKEVIQKWLQHHILDFERYGFSMGSVFLKSTNEFIGRAGLFFFYPYYGKDKEIEIGYVLHKAHWSKGYATELAQALVDWGFANLKIHKIIALTRLDNKKSQHILEKIGMRYEKKIKSEGEYFFRVCNIYK